MADADLEATQRWLTSRGFTLNGISRSRDRITFSGTAAQVATAFGATLHHYQINGERHLAPSSELTLPADLAAVTTAVLHLSDFRPHPLAHPAPRPAYTTAATNAHYLDPGDLGIMYDLPVSTNANIVGDGQSIALVGQSYVDLSTSSVVRSFLTRTDYPNSIGLLSVLVPGTGVEAISPGDAAESEIDLEYSAGLLKGGNALLVHVGSNPTYNVFDAITFAVDQNVAPVISISYGECETLMSASEIEQSNVLFQQAGIQGQTIVAAAGDEGSTACAPYTAYGNLSISQQQGLAIDFPADSPNVTAIGGTEMTPDIFAAGSSPYWFADTIVDVPNSLKSYVPEIVWNEGSLTHSIFAGGGGASSVLPRPSWQVDFPGIPSGSTRLIPDLAFQASAANPGFVLCTDDVSFFGDDTSSVCDFDQSPTYPTAGGTSFAAPAFAAMVAILNQSTQSLGQGNVNPILYNLAANSATAASAFHDITAGSNACIAGAPNCSAAGESGFTATPGYDQATGLGSLDLLQLLAMWPSPSHPAVDNTAVTLYPFYPTLNPGDTDVVSIDVTSSYNFAHPTPPSGGVSVTVDGTVVVANLAFSTTSSVDDSGSVSYTYTASQTPGYHLLAITYPGDATHGPSTSTLPILVGSVLASGNVTVAAGNVTLQPNGATTTTVTVTPAGGYNGRLFWSLSLSGGNGGTTTACYSIPTLPVQGVSSTTLSLGVGSACSSALPAARRVLRPLAVHTAATASHPGLWNAVPVASGLLLCCLTPRDPAPSSTAPHAAPHRRCIHSLGLRRRQ